MIHISMTGIGTLPKNQIEMFLVFLIAKMPNVVIREHRKLWKYINHVNFGIFRYLPCILCFFVNAVFSSEMPCFFYFVLNSILLLSQFCTF
jgi:hypothetical protein